MKIRKNYALLKQCLGGLALLLAISIITYSCKKGDKAIINDTELIEKAKEWFNAQAITSYSPSWDQATVACSKDQHFVILPSNVLLSGNEIVIKSYLVIDISAKGTKGNLVEIFNLESNGLNISENKMISNYLAGNIADLAEIDKADILFFDIGHNFIRGSNIAKGNVSNQLNLITYGNELKARLLMDKNRSMKEKVCYDWYLVYRTGAGVMISSIYLYTTCDGGGDGSSGGGSGGGKSGSKKVDVDPNARQCLKDIKAALEALGMKNTSTGTGLIASILNKLNLSTGTSFNAIITEGEMSSNHVAETTHITNPNTWGADGYVTKINFNSSYLDKSTDLKVAITMMHEYIHAYFIWNLYLIRNGQAGADEDFEKTYKILFDKSGEPLPDRYGNDIQHQQMANTFVSQMAEMLKNYATARNIPFPADKLYFEKMAWGGLQYTPAYKFAPIGADYTNSAELGKASATITLTLKCKK